MGNSMNFWSVLRVAKPFDSNGYPNCRMESSSARCHLSHGFGAGTWHMRVIASSQHLGITMDKAERVRHDNIIPHDSHMDTVGETNGYIIIHTLFPSNQVKLCPATYVSKLSWDRTTPKSPSITPAWPQSSHKLRFIQFIQQTGGDCIPFPDGLKETSRRIYIHPQHKAPPHREGPCMKSSPSNRCPRSLSRSPPWCHRGGFGTTQGVLENWSYQQSYGWKIKTLRQEMWLFNWFRIVSEGVEDQNSKHSAHKCMGQEHITQVQAECIKPVKSTTWFVSMLCFLNSSRKTIKNVVECHCGYARGEHCRFVLPFLCHRLLLNIANSFVL